VIKKRSYQYSHWLQSDVYIPVFSKPVYGQEVPYMALLLCNGPMIPSQALICFAVENVTYLYVYTAKTAKLKLSIAETPAFIFVC